MTKRIRMKDIARDLKVSIVTVSKALRNHDDISIATRQRVLDRVRELNYQPNWAARTLATQRSSRFLRRSQRELRNGWRRWVITW
jgi:LacI family transcriptional regulator